MKWQAIKKTNLNDVDALCDLLKLDPSNRTRVKRDSKFPLNLPLRLANKIQKNTLSDPLLLQFVPLVDEDVHVKGFYTDPVLECDFRQSPHLLQKYEGRALLLSTQACAMHCRYCFRRHDPCEADTLHFEKELSYLAGNPTISEVILSGGDPLSLSNRKLGALLTELAKIPHLKRVRFHTRFLIGIPERVDEGLLTLLTACPLQLIFVLHANHPREFDAAVWEALRRLRPYALLFHQAVLLKGVNDSEEALIELLESLIDNGVVPYYLHRLDKVQGAAHFEVGEQQGKALMQALAKTLPGYALPRFVKEVPGQPSKTPIL